jgi:hypothetical protein
VAKVGTSKAGGTISQQAAVHGRPYEQTNKQDSKKTELEVNADKSENMVMSRDQNAGRSKTIKIGNKLLKGRNSSNIWKQP